MRLRSSIRLREVSAEQEPLSGRTTRGSGVASSSSDSGSGPGSAEPRLPTASTVPASAAGKPFPTRIGPYTLEKQIGRGGMGEVWLGHDTRLGRRVAVKGLPRAAALDADNLRRMLREARMLATLAHPNIVTIYGLEEHEQEFYVVMEYVEGVDLSQRLAAERLTAADAVEIGLQVSQGVEAAHRAGVIHRDLKPSNVRIGPDGRVRVLDFGLARPADAGAASGSTGHSSHPLPTQQATDPSLSLHSSAGLVVGTPGYMPPEQARGEPVDARCDIFALGCILFECLSGRRAFPARAGRFQPIALLDREADWSQLPDTVPRRVRELLRGCLERTRENRLAEMSQVVNELRAAAEAIRSGGVGAPKARGAGGTKPFPTPMTEFIGRRAELSALRELFENAPVVTLSGPLGIGRTRLALRMCEQVKSTTGAPAIYVRCTADLDAPELIDRVASGLGAPSVGSFRALGRLLGQLSAFVVLDDADHCPELCEQVVSAILANGHSAAALRVVEEEGPSPVGRLLRLGGLPTRSVTSTREGESEAASLMMDRVRAKSPKAAANLTNALQLVALCRLLDGNPLAIEVVAATSRAQPLVRSMEQIQSLLPMGRASGDREERGATIIRRTLQWALALVRPEHLGHLAALSMFHGGFTLESALKFWPPEVGPSPDRSALEDSLNGLVGRGLIVLGRGFEGTPIFGIHDAVREAVLKFNLPESNP